MIQLSSVRQFRLLISRIKFDNSITHVVVRMALWIKRALLKTVDRVWDGTNKTMHKAMFSACKGGDVKTRWRHQSGGQESRVFDHQLKKMLTPNFGEELRLIACCWFSPHQLCFGVLPSGEQYAV